jgi:hypothetical protein
MQQKANEAGKMVRAPDADHGVWLTNLKADDLVEVPYAREDVKLMTVYENDGVWIRLLPEGFSSEIDNTILVNAVSGVLHYAPVQIVPPGTMDGNLSRIHTFLKTNARLSADRYALNRRVGGDAEAYYVAGARVVPPLSKTHFLVVSVHRTLAAADRQRHLKFVASQPGTYNYGTERCAIEFFIDPVHSTAKAGDVITKPDPRLSGESAEEARRLKIPLATTQDFGHDWRTCSGQDCDHCQSLANDGVIISCDHCHEPGHTDSPGGWVRDKEGLIYCEPCADELAIEAQ